MPASASSSRTECLTVDREVERRLARIHEGFLAAVGILECLVDARLASAMTEQPAPPVVRLVHRDPVDPRAQAAVAAEITHVAEDLEKDFLGDVAGVRLVVEQAVGEVVNRILEPLDELFVRLLVAGLEGGDEAVIFQCRFLFGGKARVETEVIIGGQDTLNYRTPPERRMFPGRSAA